MKQAEDVLQFWFEEIDPALWWKKDADFDEQLRERFATLHRQVARCEMPHWRTDPHARLAEIMVLDQFSRHLYRDQPDAFAWDGQALVLAQEAVRDGADRHLTDDQRGFLYLPYMHSESLLIHEQAEALYRELGNEENLRFELAHQAIIRRFGRYPHRNAALGRTSTAEELAFLREPNSSF